MQVSCELSNLRLIRDFANEKLKGLMSEKERNLLILAVDEVCANLIIHSNNCDEKASIKISLTFEKIKGGVLFEIYDYGHFFDYEKYKEPKLDEVIRERRKGSIGLLLVRRIMDKVEFLREESYNVCRLFKRIEEGSLTHQ